MASLSIVRRVPDREGPRAKSVQHLFDQNSPSYIRIAAMWGSTSRATHWPAISAPNQLPHTDFVFPAAGEVVAWSRILDVQEAVAVVNPNGDAARGGDVVVSAEFSSPGTQYVVIANTADAAAGPDGYTGSHPVGESSP
jgi:hypothetical protein